MQMPSVFMKSENKSYLDPLNPRNSYDSCVCACVCALTRAVDTGAAYDVKVVVGPVDHSLNRVVVNGDGIADVTDFQNDVEKVGRVERNQSNVCTPCQQQHL